MTDNLTDEQRQELIIKQAERRISNIAKMIYEYQKVLNNNAMNSAETMILGMDCIQAGLLLITKSCDDDSLDVKERYETYQNVFTTISNIMNNIYLDEDTLCKMVANVVAKDIKNLTIEGNKIVTE